MTEQAPAKPSDFAPLPVWSEVSLARSFLGELKEPPIMSAQVIVRGLLNTITQLENEKRRTERLLTLIENENEKLWRRIDND